MNSILGSLANSPQTSPPLHGGLRYQTFLPANLDKVERVGFTRNASQTPYVVYITTTGRRCSTFVKRKLLYELLRLLLGILKKAESRGVNREGVPPSFPELFKTVDARILSAKVTEWGGLKVKTHSKDEYAIASNNLCAFFLHYHTAAFNRLTATLNEIGAAVVDGYRTYQVNLVRCDCTVLYDCCPHRIATQIQLLNGGWASVAEYMRSLSYKLASTGETPARQFALPQPQTDRALAGYNLYARSQSAVAHNWDLVNRAADNSR